MFTSMLCGQTTQNQERKSLNLSARYGLFTFSTTHSEQSGTKFGKKKLKYCIHEKYYAVKTQNRKLYYAEV